MSSSGSIHDVLKGFPQLSNVTAFIAGSSVLSSIFSGTNLTFLAPTDDAIANRDDTSIPLEIALTYHILDGAWPTDSFTHEPQFVVTKLTNETYSNVTIAPEGQRVELIRGIDDKPYFVANNMTDTGIVTGDIEYDNGLIQIVDSVMNIPALADLVAAQAHVIYFLEILQRAQAIGADDSGLVSFVDYVQLTSNLTFFLPNTSEALQYFINETQGISAYDLGAIFTYHIVPDTILYSPDFVNGTELVTKQGDNVTIARVGNDTYINSAKILSSNYLVGNGVFHTIDSVLNRFNQSIPAAAIASTPDSHDENSSNSGLSTGGIVAISVVIPVVALSVVAGLVFYLWRRRKTTKQGVSELDGTAASGTAGVNVEPKSPIDGHSASEVHGDAVKNELQAEPSPQELSSPGTLTHPPAELE